MDQHSVSASVLSTFYAIALVSCLLAPRVAQAQACTPDSI